MKNEFTIDGQTVKNMLNDHIKRLKERAQTALDTDRFMAAAQMANEAAAAEAFEKSILTGRKYSFEEHVSIVEAPFVPGEL